jgi:hypothetical protein
MYHVTDLGAQVLRAWMGVIKEERDRLDGVLRRYMATGTVDALLAEVEGGLASVTGPAWSPVSSTARIEGRRTSRARRSQTARPEPAPPPGADEVAVAVEAKSFQLVPERSVALVEARSTVGPITFGVIGVTGTVDLGLADGAICLDHPPRAHLEIRVDGLRSGNKLYDAELLRRIDARRYPLASLDLQACMPAGSPNRYRLEGDVTFHGVTRPIEGTVTVTNDEPGRLVVEGEHVLDIRDFDIASPTVLMLRMYPDVRVQLQVEAEPGV